MNTKTEKRPIALLMFLIPLLAGDVLAAGRPPAGCGVGAYRIHDLGTVGDRANTYVMNARGLNQRGQVVGWGNDGGPYDFQDDTAFAWSPVSGLQVLPGLAGAAMSVAVALNDRGEVVGFSGAAFPMSRPVVWGRGGVRELPVPGGFLGGMAVGINNRGTVVGALITEAGRAKAVVWRDGGVVVLPLAGASGEVQGWANAVNERGWIAGMSDFKPAVWVRERPELLPVPEGARGQAFALNDRGQLVGLYSVPGGAPRAFVWESGVMEELTDGEGYTVALSINNRGMVVGSAGVGHAGGDAALWNGGRRVQLADLLPAGSGWVLLEADCINDAGVITGMGLLNGFPRVFIMTPRG